MKSLLIHLCWSKLVLASAPWSVSGNYHVGVKLHEAIGRAVGKELMCARFLSVSIFIFVFGGLCMLIQILKKFSTDLKNYFFIKEGMDPRSDMGNIRSFKQNA